MVGLVLGATGALGAACVREMQSSSWTVLQGGRGSSDRSPSWVDVSRDGWAGGVGADRLSAVVWAQGANASGGLEGPILEQLESLLSANVTFVVQSLRELIDAQAIQVGARLVIIGSVWQLVARQDKLAYVVSKSAVTGLVRALAADLASRDIAVNAVLPGVVDTPMTRSHLTAEQIDRVVRETPSGRLVTSTEVARTVSWLAGTQSRGINGQSLVVDGGWSVVRDV